MHADKNSSYEEFAFFLGVSANTDYNRCPSRKRVSLVRKKNNAFRIGHSFAVFQKAYTFENSQANHFKTPL